MEQKILPGNITIETDPEETRKFYSVLPRITEECSCDGCRNYEAATEFFPREVKEFFDRLGIDVKKAAEVYTIGEEGSTRIYGGFYHLCGRLIRGCGSWTEENRSIPDAVRGDAPEMEEGSYTLSEGYAVRFTDEISLPEDPLPEPALQMEIEFSKVPWVL